MITSLVVFADLKKEKSWKVIGPSVVFRWQINKVLSSISVLLIGIGQVHPEYFGTK